MAPGQLVKIPTVAYEETAEGAKEKEGKAQELKFFVQASDDKLETNTTASEERVFIHPSSMNFGISNYSCPWLVYNSLVQTSKPFLCDVMECNGYSSKGVIMIDNWCHLLASPKIGMLLGGNHSLFYCEEHDDSLILIVTNMMIPSEFEKMHIFFVLLRMAKNERKRTYHGVHVIHVS